MIFLLIRKMSATFGRLQNQSLELRDGLNVIQAPNETGKSTWCAFLAAMLFGINSRERDKAGFIADKNRFAPWAGVSMSGRLDCRAGEQELTLTRLTRRQTAPMGEFQAVYAGTGEAVPGLTGQNCGEKLLGVSREVFERSAFIRQTGLAVTQDPGLERRIAALITSGEEGTSYSEAADTLKKQLNRRRHNKTGQLPALEAELQETEHQLEELEALEAQLVSARGRMEALETEKAALEEELSACDRWEASRRRQALAQAEAAARETAERAAELRRRIEEERIPENDAIGRLRGAIVNLETVRRSLKKAREEQDEARKQVLRAEAAVNDSPFAGHTPEQAARLPLDLEPKPRFPLWAGILWVLAGIGLGLLLWTQSLQGRIGMPENALLLSIGCGCGVFGMGLLITGFLTERKQSKWETRAGELRQRRQKELDEFTALCRAAESAQSDLSAKSAAAETLYSTLTTNEQGILLEVRRFASAAFDVPAADAALRACAVRRRELTEAENTARETRLRFDLLAQQTTAGDVEEAFSAPARDRETVSAQLEEARNALDAAHSEADRLSGRLHALGDPVVLRSSAAHLREEIQAAEGEYGAIQLAMEALDTANTALQTRFSPELGRRAAEIFRELTDGRYTGVTLDRSFHLSAEPAGDSVYRDAALLSAGAADQLYLAVRLAICDLVLPEERQVPIVLDDALANFDDARCAAALRYLRNAAENRQILLFTCHSREAEFFAGDPQVSIQRLTEGAVLV
ncbi:ATP-binding protein [Oscillibacter sp.]|uniref:ATP-binding protein n=1 Tax=Oscillibacter sp. TaxID=1945593 RepID=UPI0025E27149|nr:AAA family ATPase [Oscillibacter sp.]